MTRELRPDHRVAEWPASRTTVLTGTVVDQAQLHGYIERFEELGLELLTVQQMKEAS